MPHLGTCDRYILLRDLRWVLILAGTPAGGYVDASHTITASPPWRPYWLEPDKHARKDETEERDEGAGTVEVLALMKTGSGIRCAQKDGIAGI